MTMPIAERISSARRLFRIPVFSDNVPLAVVAFLILAFHVLAGAYVQRALSPEPADQKEIVISYGD
jgi:hypothetical protein